MFPTVRGSFDRLNSNGKRKEFVTTVDCYQLVKVSGISVAGCSEFMTYMTYSVK